jgi:hypothetical protein
MYLNLIAFRYIRLLATVAANIGEGAGPRRQARLFPEMANPFGLVSSLDTGPGEHLARSPSEYSFGGRAPGPPHQPTGSCTSGLDEVRFSMMSFLERRRIATATYMAVVRQWQKM